MNLADSYKSLLRQEIAEARFKFERLLQFKGKSSGSLIVKEVEGSVVTLSPESDAAFQSFNVARIQETSPVGIQEVIRILAQGGRKHILVTVPLGMPDVSFQELAAQGYGVFHHRSVLGLRKTPSGSFAKIPGIRVEFGDADEQYSAAHFVLNSFHPTTRQDFDASYTYWLARNENARLFIARKSEIPVGMGILSWSGDSGILSSGVVSPPTRGEGIQKTIIQRRIQDAHRLGLQVLFAPGVPPFSASEANLRKCGFEPICTRSLWKML